jgi:hypothetical protein
MLQLVYMYITNVPKYCDIETHFYATPEIRACNNRTSVARGVFYVVRIYLLLDNGPINMHS